MSANHHHHTSKPHLVASLELCNYGVYYAGDKFVCKLVLCARDGALPSAATAASETTTTTTTTAGSSNGTTPSSGSSPMMTRKGPASVDGVASGQHATVRVGCVVVQLQGYCVLDKTLVKESAAVGLQQVQDEENKKVAGAFNSQNPKSDRSTLFYATPAIIVVTNLALQVGTSKTYVFETILPANLPASHRGKAAKFAYRAVVVIGSKSLDQSKLSCAPSTSVSTPTSTPITPSSSFLSLLPGTTMSPFKSTTAAPSSTLSAGAGAAPHETIETLRVSFRVFHAVQENGTTLPFNLQWPICSHPSNHVVYCEDERLENTKLRELQLSGAASAIIQSNFNAIKSEPIIELPEIDSFLPAYKPYSTLLNITSLLQSSKQSTKSLYKISTAQGLVAHLILPKTCCRLGEAFQAVLDFSGSTRACLMFCVSLATLEEVQEPFVVKTADASLRSTTTVVAEHVEHSLNLRQTSISLAVPVDSSPSFSTLAVNVKWQLQCEFIVASASSDEHSSIVKEAHPDHFLITLPPQIKSERFVLNVPVTMYATIPEIARPSILSKSIETAL